MQIAFSESVYQGTWSKKLYFSLKTEISCRINSSYWLCPQTYTHFRYLSANFWLSLSCIQFHSLHLDCFMASASWVLTYALTNSGLFSKPPIHSSLSLSGPNHKDLLSFSLHPEHLTSGITSPYKSHTAPFIQWWGPYKPYEENTRIP